MNYVGYRALIKLNRILRFKSLGLAVEILCFSYLDRSLKIKISSIAYLLNSFRPLIAKTFFRTGFNKKLTSLTLICFNFFKSDLLALYLGDIVKKTKNKRHVRNLYSAFNIIRPIFNKQLIPLSGFKFKIAGRLGGRLRKSCFIFELGRLRLLSFSAHINYVCHYVFTQYGAFSLKLWLREFDELSNV